MVRYASFNLIVSIFYNLLVLPKPSMISCDKISTHVSGTPGRHQCMQSWPQIATASFLPSHMAGWASALNSLKCVKSTTWMFVPCNTFSITKFICLASLLTPLFLGSNHKSSCSGVSILLFRLMLENAKAKEQNGTESTRKREIFKPLKNIKCNLEFDIYARCYAGAWQ